MVFRALFGKIKQGLAKTRIVFSGVASLFRLRGRVDRDFLSKLEEKLYSADVGTAATSQIVDQVRQSFLDKEITGDVEAFVKQKLREQLTSEGNELRFAPSGPTCACACTTPTAASPRCAATASAASPSSPTITA